MDKRLISGHKRFPTQSDSCTTSPKKAKMSIFIHQLNKCINVLHERSRLTLSPRAMSAVQGTIFAPSC